MDLFVARRYFERLLVLVDRAVEKFLLLVYGRKAKVRVDVVDVLRKHLLVFGSGKIEAVLRFKAFCEPEVPRRVLRVDVDSLLEIVHGVVYAFFVQVYFAQTHQRLERRGVDRNRLQQ
ncbi:MAG: hypothetical protein ACD_47C00125G0004 [uncultured bacterium]|nr:MAG: hypothetical protein ACD_47C00125G0004 [uncultured bacterium]